MQFAVDVVHLHNQVVAVPHSVVFIMGVPCLVHTQSRARPHSVFIMHVVLCFNADLSMEQCSLDSSSQSTVDGLKVRWSLLNMWTVRVRLSMQEYSDSRSVRLSC